MSVGQDIWRNVMFMLGSKTNDGIRLKHGNDQSSSYTQMLLDARAPISRMGIADAHIITCFAIEEALA